MSELKTGVGDDEKSKKSEDVAPLWGE